jgi:hypothetical protein
MTMALRFKNSAMSEGQGTPNAGSRRVVRAFVLVVPPIRSRQLLVLPAILPAFLIAWLESTDALLSRINKKRSATKDGALTRRRRDVGKFELDQAECACSDTTLSKQSKG